jgi:hypothetical protein
MGQLRPPLLKGLVGLRASNGKFLSVMPDGTAFFSGDSVGPCETFELIPSESYYFLKNSNDRYLCVEPPGSVVVNRTVAREWERLTLRPLGHRHFSIQSHHKKFLTVLPDGRPNGTALTVGALEIFWIKHVMLLFTGTNKHIKSYHGYFMSPEPDYSLWCADEGPSAQNAFEFILVAKPAYRIRTPSGRFLTADEDGRVSVGKEEAGDREVFTVKKHGKGQWSLRTAHGKFVSVLPNGKVEAKRDIVAEWEQFTFG